MQTRTTIADGGATAKAIDYSIKRWPALERYAGSGVLPIDNNPVENSIRLTLFHHRAVRSPQVTPSAGAQKP